ncbi:MAG: hypothetical protein QF696_00865, partial [Acidimicrobiales bacterium]|nr:hypothetical protein [Acidimicrobiales bacterium]
LDMDSNEAKSIAPTSSLERSSEWDWPTTCIRYLLGCGWAQNRLVGPTNWQKLTPFDVRLASML